MGRPERPIEDEDGGLGGFARALRQLREEAGRPTYEAMARGSKVSRSTLAQAAAGQHLPRWRTVEQYVRYCKGDVSQWQQRWETLDRAPRVVGPAGGPEPAPDEPRPHRTRWFRPRRRLLIGGAVVLALLAGGAAVTLGGRDATPVLPPGQAKPPLVEAPGVRCDAVADAAVVIEALSSDDGEPTVGTFNTMTLFVSRPPQPGATYWVLLHLYRDDGNAIIAKAKLRSTGGRDRVALRFNDAVGSKRDIYVVEADEAASQLFERNLASQYDGTADRSRISPVAPVVSSTCFVEKQRAD